MSKDHLNKIAATLRGARPQRTAEVQAFVGVGRGAYKVVMTADTAADDNALSEEVSRLSEGRARLVPGSVVRRGELCVAFVRSNTISKPLDATFEMMTASQAVDASGKIWSVVVGDDGSKRVALEAGDDLEGIFKARMAARHNVVSPAAGQGLAVASFGNGDAVRYLDTASHEVKYGVAFHTTAGDVVVGRDGSPVTVDSLQVLSAADKRVLPAPLQVQGVPATATLAPEKLNTILDFLKKAYGDASEAMIDRFRELTTKAA